MIDYYLITKPGIILGNLLTLVAGFLLASHGTVDIVLFLATLSSLSLIIASACVFNNYIDRFTDQKMKRTKQRSLVLGTISERGAILFATVLGLSGALVLGILTNLLTLGIASFGFLTYVLLYSFLKYRTILATAIGSVAGATPPVIGYCAVTNQLDPAALILFAIMILWQMPHFFAIALLHYDDYRAADIPLLPIRKGVLRTKIHMLLYIVAFCAVVSLLTVLGYTGSLYLSVTLLAGLLWLLLSLKGFKCSDDKVWGRQMFQLSLITIGCLCIVISFESLTS